MRAVVYRETGPSSVLEVVERDLPEPGTDEVRVRLVRSGVNPTDWKFRASTMAGHVEVVPGQDGAGVIDAVGPGVDRYAVGDRVWTILAQHGRPYGTAAEFTVQPVERVVALPEGASYDLGASLGVPAVTAHRALTASQDGPTRLAPGALDRTVVLVAGGAGAVGNAAIQLARWAGATVITTVSSDEKAALTIAPLALTVAPAQARVCSIDHVSYKAPKKGSVVWIPTNLHAIWQKGGGHQSRTTQEGSDTSKTKGSSDAVGGEAGASFGFGSASASYDHTWDRSTTYSTSYSSSWSYELNLPHAKSRSRLYKKGFEFPIVQRTIYTNGRDPRVTKWSVVAPVNKNGSGTYLWAVETYKNRGKLQH